MILPDAAFPSAQISVQTDQPKAISPDLWGIFFEDLNYAADGGLYAELIQNRSFAYSSADHREWNFLTGWNVATRRGCYSLALGDAEPIHPHNPHYLQLHLDGEVDLKNGGFDGIALRAGEDYEVSLFARRLNGAIEPLSVELQSRNGETLGAATLPAPTENWAKISATIRCDANERDGRFVVRLAGQGVLAVDVISLFPRATFRNRRNGLRADLAQTIADLKPKFLRFPGGCLAHGDGLDNMYRWKETIGPVETRREQFNRPLS